jgi:hypothetical protein
VRGWGADGGRNDSDGLGGLAGPTLHETRPCTAPVTGPLIPSLERVCLNCLEGRLA